MALVRNFTSSTSLPNQLTLNWNQPLDFNNSTDEIIITRTSNSYPMELFNSNFPTKATDSRGIEIFRGSTIVGTNPGTISVTQNILTDSSALFPTSPSLIGRLLRDSNSQVFKIISNTSTSVTLDGNPANGIYVILADFPTSSQIQQNYELDIRTTSSPGIISNLVQFISGSFIISTFTQDQLANMIFRDGAGNKYIIKSNSSNTITLYTSDTPVVGSNMAILNSFFNSTPQPFIDNFKTDIEAANRIGTGLLNDQFYYYTAFTLALGVDIAQAEFATIDSPNSTQSSALSTKDGAFGDLLYNSYWPTVFRQLDSNLDLQYLMQVFGFQFNELHSLITTFTLQNTEKVYTTALLPLSEQFGLPSIGFTIGSDTLRRIAERMIDAWKLKGSKQGIYEFIKIITTWDITNGTGDISLAISDFLPNVTALRFFDPNLGKFNTRITKTDPFVAGGRFAVSLPGIVIPGFFSFREFIINIPNVALFVGKTTNITSSGNNTTITDTSANFGSTNSLVDNFILPNESEPSSIFRIISNTSTSITVSGTINNKSAGGTYAVLSPLNASRFIVLNKLLPSYIPFGTIAGFNFT